MLDYQILWLFILVFVLWFFIWKFVYETYVNKKEKKLDERLEKIENEYYETINQAQRKAESIIEDANKESQQKLNRVEILEDRLSKKEEKLEQEKSELAEKKEEVNQLKEDINNEHQKQIEKLEEISNLSKQEAKEKLFDIIKSENKEEISNFINKQEQLKQEESEKVAHWIISKILPRVWVNNVSEFTISIVDLPSEETKWKIIWKEWRNISFFERLTWSEIIIDDTPLVVNVSCFDPEKRFVATETLKKLINDWRINPIYIEKYYNEVVSDFDNYVLEKWKEALTSLSLPMMKPDIVKMIWQFYFRYSYWQNLWIHSIEVARICEAIASEMKLDSVLAKKAWLFHDIWKLKNGAWIAHSKAWWEILRKFGLNETIINAAESHHFDIQPDNPISWIVAAADGISAWRPWARLNTKNMFIERMENLEKLISWIDWVKKVYIMQAWREIMSFVDPEKVDDVQLQEILKIISSKIEWQLDYPWTIRVVWIRENKVTSYIS